MASHSSSKRNYWVVLQRERCAIDGCFHFDSPQNVVHTLLLFNMVSFFGIATSEGVFMGKKLSQVLEESGIPLNFQAGGTASGEVANREITREPG